MLEKELREIHEKLDHIILVLDKVFSIHTAEKTEPTLKSVNILDPELVKQFFGSKEAERTIINVINRNKKSQ